MPANPSPSDCARLTVRQGKATYPAWTPEVGMMAFCTLETRQHTYLLDSFTGRAEGDKRAKALPSRMRASLRRIAELARNHPRGRNSGGLPRLSGILVPAGDWRVVLGGIVVHTLKGREGYVLVFIEGELDARRPLTIRVPSVPLRTP